MSNLISNKADLDLPIRSHKVLGIGRFGRKIVLLSSFVTLFAVIVIGILFTFRMTTRMSEDAANEVRILSGYTASELGLAISTGSIDQLEPVMERIEKEESVKSVLLYDSDGDLLLAKPVKAQLPVTLQKILLNGYQTKSISYSADIIFASAVQFDEDEDDENEEEEQTNDEIKNIEIVGYLVVGLDLEHIKASQIQVIILMVVAGGVVIILGGLLFGFMLSNIVSDLIDLRNAAVHIGAGDLETKVEIDSNDELGELAETFNGMAEGLKEAREKLEASEAAAIAAKEARGTFLASMRHELRTPMNAVLGMSMLLQGSDLDREQRNYVETIEGSGEALLAVINDILDFSKIGAGKLEIESIPYDLHRCIEGSLKIIDSRATEKEVKTICEIDASCPTGLVGDQGRLRQILLNLLSNAVKFTSEGEILVKARGTKMTDGDFEVHISVEDSGIGMTKDSIGKLFQQYSQAESSTSRRYGGTGLGLNISKMLAELMGGRMWVESVIGKGSTFHFTIRGKVGEFKDEKVSDATDIIQLAEGIGQNHPLKILVAEDNAVNQKVLKMLLNRLGYEPEVVSDGDEALTAALREPWDLILMDVRMPRMDGYEATTLIREQVSKSEQPMIVGCSADAMSGDAEAAIKAGMDDYITKPIQIKMLVKTLLACPSRSKHSFEGAASIVPGRESEDLKEGKAAHEVSDFGELLKYDEVMEMFDGDFEIFKDISVTMKEDCRNLIKEIETALDESNSEVVGDSAHALKGVVSLFAVDELVRKTQDLEDCGKHKDLETAKNIFPTVRQQVEQLINEVDKKLEYEL